jgi:hypothetical protein
MRGLKLRGLQAVTLGPQLIRAELGYGLRLQGPASLYIMLKLKCAFLNHHKQEASRNTTEYNIVP